MRTRPLFKVSCLIGHCLTALLIKYGRHRLLRASRSGLAQFSSFLSEAALRRSRVVVSVPRISRYRVLLGSDLARVNRRLSMSNLFLLGVPISSLDRSCAGDQASLSCKATTILSKWLFDDYSVTGLQTGYQRGVCPLLSLLLGLDLLLVAALLK